MQRTLAAVLLLLGASPALAQPVFGPLCGPGFGGGFAYRFYAAPVLPYYPGLFPLSGPGWGPGYGNPFFLPQPTLAAPSVVIVPRPVVIGGNIDPVELEPLAPNRNIPLRPNDYLVISPRKDRAVPGTPAVPPVMPKADRPAPPALRFDPFAPLPVLGRNDTPEADPFAEAARQVKQAREVFAESQYGRSAEHLEQAIRVKPDDPLPYFLKAQVHIASGQYVEAATSIREGLKRAPNWPASRFDPKSLYGAKPELFDAHLAELRKSAEANPAEPTLQFLLAYQLWFAGDRKEASAILRRARSSVEDAAEFDLFLREVEK